MASSEHKDDPALAAIAEAAIRDDATQATTVTSSTPSNRPDGTTSPNIKQEGH